jgi:hypothetical protein
MVGLLRAVAWVVAWVALVGVLAACEPRDDQPGLWLSGEEAAALPTDWTFTDDHREIAVEVATPYLIRHSVTIWCAQVGGTLYIAAAAPDTKNWPGWVEDDPNVRLKIGDAVYAVALDRLSAEDEIASVTQAYLQKYELDSIGGGGAVRYWRVGS